MKRVVFLNGEYVPEERAAIPVWDFGFTMGATVTEQLRTFGGRLRFLDAHFARLATGLDVLGVTRDVVLDELSEVIPAFVVKHQTARPEVEEWGIGVCVTPGSSRDAAGDRAPTRLVYCYPLDTIQLEAMYRDGIRLSTVNVAEIDGKSVPKTVKHRSRFHYWLADREAEKSFAGSRPLLLDLAGNVAESSIASIVAVSGNTVFVPPSSAVLDSTSLQMLQPLLGELGFQLKEQEISLEALVGSDEVWWVNATSVIAPVVEIDQQGIGCGEGRGRAGEGFLRVKTAWQSQWLGRSD